MREDNSEQHSTIVGRSSRELHGFIYGFETKDEREEMLTMMANQTRTDFRHHTCNSSWPIRENMMNFVEHFNEQNDSNLFSTKIGELDEITVVEKVDADSIFLIDKTAPYFMM